MDKQPQSLHNELVNSTPILDRLVAQSVNLDELDYLAKQMESFCGSEHIQFQAMASKLCLSDVKDFINLTFCYQESTVITGFSDLERAGKSHSLTVNGGSMLMEEYGKVDGQGVVLDLIQSGKGVVTPYGVVYDNNMKLEQIYTGASFPQYQYKTPLLTLGVRSSLRSAGPWKQPGCICLRQSSRLPERCTALGLPIRTQRITLRTAP